MWTFTTDARAVHAIRRVLGGEKGFSLLELLVGLTLALCLALAIAPLWASSESVVSGEGDATVWMLQGRVADARFERDVRTAGCSGCLFGTSAIVLLASASQVVMLEQMPGGQVPLLVEWELTGGALMRRWGPCPDHVPAAFSHTLYSDSKTMLEGVDVGRSAFTYAVAGREAGAAMAQGDLPYVEGVALHVVRDTDRAAAGVEWSASARVGL